ncbi:MAG TPA: DUF327 family protein [Treponemataceae bacterium]|jgi:uncharacterized protein YaaR (DUF327 family)|nr:DUF327 family protein [Treponemataceae bacterium]
MAAPGSVDPASPFFSSIAQQAALQSGAHRAQTARKEKPSVRKFDGVLRERLSDAEEASEAELPGNIAGLGTDEALSALLDEVHSAGDVLKERQTPETIMAYKSAVRTFVRFVVDRAFTVTETTSGGNVLKRKKFTQVEIIDQKLEQLAAGILSNQKDQLGLLGKIEEINGLLVDLLH